MSSDDVKSASIERQAPAITGNNGLSRQLDSSLVLRSRADNRRLSEVPRVLPPLSRRAKVLALLRRPQWEYIIKFSIFFSKVISLVRPCSPLAPNPWIYYFLLGLAVVDFNSLTPRTTFVLLLIHMSVLSIASYIGSLCLY